MGMLYLQDETVVKIKEIATKERRSPSVVVEMMLEDREKKQKQEKK